MSSKAIQFRVTLSGKVENLNVSFVWTGFHKSSSITSTSTMKYSTCWANLHLPEFLVSELIFIITGKWFFAPAFLYPSFRSLTLRSRSSLIFSSFRALSLSGSDQVINYLCGQAAFRRCEAACFQASFQVVYPVLMLRSLKIWNILKRILLERWAFYALKLRAKSDKKSEEKSINAPIWFVQPNQLQLSEIAW